MTAAGTFVRRNFEPLVLSVQVLVDLLVVGLACVLAWWIREQAFAGGGIYGPASSTPLELYREVFAITAAVCLVSFHTFGLYSASKSLLNVEEYKAVAKSSVVSFFVVLVLLFFLRETNATTDGGGIYAPFLWLHKEFELKVNPDYLSRVTLLLSFVFIMLMTIVSRFCSFRVIQRLHERGIGNRNVLVVGAGWTGRKLQEKFLHVPTLGPELHRLRRRRRGAGGKLDRSRAGPRDRQGPQARRRRAEDRRGVHLAARDQGVGGPGDLLHARRDGDAPTSWCRASTT